MASTLSEHPLLSHTTPNPVASEQPQPSGIARRFNALAPAQVVAAALVIVGAVAVFVGWFGVSGTADVWEQIPYVVSGGIGGAVCAAVGIALYLGHEHACDREEIGRLVERLDRLEVGLAGEFDDMAAKLRSTGRTRK